MNKTQTSRLSKNVFVPSHPFCRYPVDSHLLMPVSLTFAFSLRTIPRWCYKTLFSEEKKCYQQKSHHTDLLWTGIIEMGQLHIMLKPPKNFQFGSHVHSCALEWKTVRPSFIDSLGLGIKFNNNKTPLLLLSFIFSRLLGGCLSSFH